MDYLAKVRKIVPNDLKFVIEDVTDGDPTRIGITWHVEAGPGVVFPFSRGCSFYRLNERGQIVQVRQGRQCRWWWRRWCRAHLVRNASDLLRNQSSPCCRVKHQRP